MHMKNKSLMAAVAEEFQKAKAGAIKVTVGISGTEKEKIDFRDLSPYIVLPIREVQ